MTQLNTPYPATAYLTGFLREQGYAVAQRDMAIDTLLSILSHQGLQEIAELIEENYADFDDDELPDSIYQFFVERDLYLTRTSSAIRFLQGKDSSLALRIASC